MSKYIVDGQTMTDIADAVREMRLHDEAMAPAEMPDEIRAIKSGLGQDINSFVREDDEWTRPDGWPDLDSIVIPDGFDGVYMTYDLSKTVGYGWIGVYCKVEKINTATSFTAERGHLENGIFVADYTVTVPSSDYYFREALDEANGVIQLWRVYSDDHIVRCALATNSAVTNDCFDNNLQPMVERRGVLPYVTDLSSANGSSATYTTMGTVWLERDNLLPGTVGVVFSLSSMYSNCYRLEKVSLDWNTSSWVVRAMNMMFNNCERLRSVDFSAWDTNKWLVTSLADMFHGCITLKTVDLSHWDTSSWTVNNISGMFNLCRSAEMIDLTGIDSSNWDVTNLGSTFAYCHNLKHINGIEMLDTHNWHVTNLSTVFMTCFSLIDLDLSGWDTANWAVTNMANFAANCFSLRKLDISTWDTSNWRVTNVGGAFQYCYVLPELDLSGWDTSGWALTNMESIFNNCKSIKELDLSGWNTSNWALTTTGFRYVFNYMNSVKKIDLSGWDTSGWTVMDIRSMFYENFSLESIPGIGDFDTSIWKVTHISNMFYRCMSLTNIDLSRWDTSGWAVIDCGSMFNACAKLKNNAGIENWDTSNWPCTNVSSMFTGFYSMRNIDLSDWDAAKFNLAGIYAMFSECYNVDKIIFPDTLSLEAVTNASYSVFSAPASLKECNFYKLKNANASINSWNCLSRASLLALISKLQQTATTRTLTIGKVNKLKLTPEEIAIATQKGWTVA